MINPYIADHEVKEPTPEPRKATLMETLCMLILMFFAGYGGVSFLKDSKVIIKHNGNYEFWFTPEVRKWIHGR